MAELRIRVEPELLEAIDELAEKENYPSRNVLVNEILANYIACKDRFLIKALPPIVASLCQQELKSQSESTEKLIENVMTMFLKILNDLDDLRSVFYSELPEK
ncbi:ribbon-helix-helix protein, CopG family [Ruminococcus sp. Marseille-P6503]|uniref:ribbon-helix-helix protein, CopG family n=1 Tax=Ruminococcus sp. Marseille-P6503 TaxID=2364796 RepID=UPI000F54ADD6|nr:ribbon-helix-helix protein, CopG family [Ruminococcus sp. Marseille-P6503]